MLLGLAGVATPFAPGSEYESPGEESSGRVCDELAQGMWKWAVSPGRWNLLLLLAGLWFRESKNRKQALETEDKVAVPTVVGLRIVSVPLFIHSFWWRHKQAK